MTKKMFFLRFLLVFALLVPISFAQVTAPEEIIAWNILTMKAGETGFIGAGYLLITLDRTMYIYLGAPLYLTDEIFSEMVRIRRDSTGYYAFWNKAYTHKWQLSVVPPEASWYPLAGFTLEGKN